MNNEEFNKKYNINENEINANGFRILRKVVGIIFIVCCVLYVVGNLIWRFYESNKTKDYVYCIGTVTSVTEHEEWRHSNRRYRKFTYYSVSVEFTPEGWLGTDIVGADFDRKKYSEGDKVVVCYPKNQIYKAFIAKKDWLTKGYIHADARFDLGLICAGVIFLIGVGYVITS